jgi:uncharacterized protein (TIGR03083 family)
MIRDLISAERRELADLLASLSDEQWDAPTLCDGWAVRHVVAHVTMPFRYSTPRFIVRIALAGGSFQRMSDGVARKDGALPRATLISGLADNIGHPWKPPGDGYENALTHDVIHGLDISRGIGLELPVQPAAMKAVLDTISGPKSMTYFGVRLDGVRLEATDVGWSRGDGKVIAGSGQDLALLMTGRGRAARNLTGPGLALFPHHAGQASPAARAAQQPGGAT